ncbi:Ornithine_decarboxylase [Hexamita inflata]|uniref:ornithine decarboxylase n=1 Tax=Hexamita inflata TaxID=28002 RepID=A0AA86NTW2_9EUKA|nr:Ornithine decarboxylase [Hexamita inflata]CAI9962623.1 Ornithine decarboxylase [Hexamita inflata]
MTEQSLAKRLSDLQPHIIPNNDSTDYMLKYCMEKDLDAMAVVNVSILKRQVELWKRAMPSVWPHYAIKCNPHPVIVRTLHELGCGFDAASPNEVEKALSVGSTISSIIYANPQKQAVNIKKVYELGVDTFTFDSEMELIKMIENTPEGKIGQFVLRILPVNTGAHQNFGSKFGASKKESERLLKLAQRLAQTHKNFTIAGFSFHVGTGCPFGEAYVKAIQECTRLCSLAQELGFAPKLIDIGGGFITQEALLHLKDHESIPSFNFMDIGAAIEKQLIEARKVFGEDMKAISEPGRFFASNCVKLVTRIYGRRIMFDDNEPDVIEQMPKVDEEESLTESDMMIRQNKIEHVKYYVGEGMYGYFNNIMFDHVLPNMRFFRNEFPLDEQDCEKHISYIFGPTCDSMDCILEGKQIPLLEIGDFIVVECFGAYTWAGATEFNGIAVTQMVTVVEPEDA